MMKKMYESFTHRHIHTLEPATQLQNPPSSGQQWKPKMKKGLLSGLDLLQGPTWPSKPPAAMLMSVVHVAAPDLDEA